MNQITPSESRVMYQDCSQLECYCQFGSSPRTTIGPSDDWSGDTAIDGDTGSEPLPGGRSVPACRHPAFSELPRAPNPPLREGHFKQTPSIDAAASPGSRQLLATMGDAHDRCALIDVGRKPPVGVTSKLTNSLENHTHRLLEANVRVQGARS